MHLSLRGSTWLAAGFCWILILAVSASLSAQDISTGTNTVSPYSIFGVGDLADQALSRNYGMGSVSLGSFDRYNVNRVNPANLTDLALTSVELSFNYRHNYQNTSSSSAYSRTGGLTGLNFAFPTRRNFVLAAGITPLSSVGYRVSRNAIVNDGVTPQVYRSTSLGDGGLTELGLSGARRFWKNRVSAGLSVNHVFGSTSESRATTILNTDITQTAQFDLTTELRGWNAVIGLSYTDTLRTAVEAFRVGLTYRTAMALVGEQRVTGIGSSTFDTLSTQSGRPTLPAEWALGVGYTDGRRYTVGLDLRYEDWSAFRYFDQVASYGSRLRANLGVEWVPAYNGKSWFQRLSYRGGVRYEQGHLRVRGRSIDGFSGTLGMGIPINRNLSFINVAVSYGRRGTLDEGLLREHYYQFVIGLNFNELWFVKRRYD